MASFFLTLKKYIISLGILKEEYAEQITKNHVIGLVGGAYLAYHLFFFFSYKIKSQRVLNQAIKVLFDRNSKIVDFDIRPELDVKKILAMDIQAL